jgi:methyl-accepting chemotaxis protein
MKISGRLWLIVAAAIMGMVAVIAISLVQMRADLVSERQVKIRNFVEAASALITSYEEQVKTGALTQDEAQAQVLSRIATLRYGEGDYVWVHRLSDLVLISHPNKKIVGTALPQMKDDEGKPLFESFNSIVREKGGGSILYHWPRPGQTQPEPKLSYVAGFAPWGWVVGSGTYVDDIDTTFRQRAVFYGLIALMAIVAVGAFATFLARGITRPLHDVTEAIAALTNVGHDVTILHTGRHDEIGTLARGLVIFRDRIAESALADMARRSEHEAATRRHAGIERVTHDFNEAVSGVLQAVSASASQLHDAAQTLAMNAEMTGQRATAVAAAAEQAATNVQTVAAATEEMSAAEAEISGQACRATGIARTALEDATRANSIVGGLSKAAAAIGDVVNLISDIAGQTNLLALNATIEAARAGEAGKGFAVVANEVKNLANQTAKATDEIVRQVNGIQAVSRESVDVIGAITHTISTINETSSAIASAVEEQGAATREITRNIAEAASGTKEVTSNITEVSGAAGKTGILAVNVLMAATGLHKQADQLRTEVVQFLASVKEAGNRRLFERVSVQLSAQLVVDGANISATVVDVSLGGARLSSNATAKSGAACTLTISGWPPVTSRIITTESGFVRVQFALDEQTRELLRPNLAELQGKAA